MADAPAARPLSPHLQIWRFTAAMAASITHRGTGMALYGGAGLLTIWFLSAALGPQIHDPVSAIVGSWFGRIVLYLFAWSLFFHTMNGLRHLVWDAGYALAPKSASVSAWAIYILATVFTVIVIFAAGGGA